MWESASFKRPYSVKLASRIMTISESYLINSSWFIPRGFILKSYHCFAKCAHDTEWSPWCNIQTACSINPLHCSLLPTPVDVSPTNIPSALNVTPMFLLHLPRMLFCTPLPSAGNYYLLLGFSMYISTEAFIILLFHLFVYGQCAHMTKNSNCVKTSQSKKIFYPSLLLGYPASFLQK